MRISMLTAAAGLLVSMLASMLAGAPVAGITPEPPAVAAPPGPSPPETVEQGPTASDGRLPGDARMQAGVALFWVPTSVVMSGLSGERSANPGAQAFGIRPTIDRYLSPHLSLGLAVPVLLNLKHAGSANESATEVDLLVRFAGWMPVSTDAQIYGFVGTGAYVIFLPDGLKMADRGSDPIGIAAVFGCGGRWSPSPRWFLTAEAGLHIGVKPGGLVGVTYPEATQYLDVGVGVGLPF